MLCPCGEFNSNIAFVQECASPFGKVVKKKIYLLKAKQKQNFVTIKSRHQYARSRIILTTL
jgi:hypothetical protein